MGGQTHHAVKRGRSKLAAADQVSGYSKAANALGVTSKQLREWVDAGAPILRPPKNGRAALFSIQALQVWCTAHGKKGGLKNGNGNAAPTPADQLAIERVKAARAERIRKELETAKLQGRLVDVDMVERDYRKMGEAIVRKLTAMPAQMAPALATVSKPGEVQKLLREAIDDVLREITELSP